MLDNQSDKFCLSVDEAASRMSLSRRMIYREFSAGRLKFLKAGKRTLVATSAIQEWIEAASQPAKTAA